MNSILLIVFLPLLAAIVGGLGNRMLGNTAVKLLTTGALFVSCALSWPIFLGFVSGNAEPYVVPVLQLGAIGQPQFRLGAAGRYADGGDAGGDHFRLRARASL